MRTTLTLEPDVESLIRETIYKTGKTFKQAVNDALRVGLGSKTKAVKTERFVFPTYDMGVPLVDLTKALSLAYELDDQETIRKMQERDAKAA
jgi:hypothetical protein